MAKDAVEQRVGERGEPAVRTLFAIGQDARLNHRFELTTGVLGEECAEALRSFFATLRARARSRASSGVR